MQVGHVSAWRPGPASSVKDALGCGVSIAAPRCAMTVTYIHSSVCESVYR